MFQQLCCLFALSSNVFPRHSVYVQVRTNSNMIFITIIFLSPSGSLTLGNILRLLPQTDNVNKLSKLAFIKVTHLATKA